MKNTWLIRRKQLSNKEEYRLGDALLPLWGCSCIMSPMELLRINKHNQDYAFFNALNQEAFPDEERWDLHHALHYPIPADVMGIYDAGKPVGLYMALSNEKAVYVCYLAIHKDLRGHGYGSKALKCICEHYQGKQICLDLEKQDPKADNAHQRKIRKEFYLRNGFYETHYSMNFWDLSFELLCFDAHFDADLFRELCVYLTTDEIDPHIIWEG